MRTFSSVFWVWLRGGNREADSFLAEGRIHNGRPNQLKNTEIRASLQKIWALERVKMHLSMNSLGFPGIPT